MIVMDASAAMSALVDDSHARSLLAESHVSVPHLIDSELANALRRRVFAGEIGVGDAQAALNVWRHLAVHRFPVNGLLERIWGLRDNLSAYDASYVALAEALRCALVTADDRISSAPGLRCQVVTVPR